MQRKQGKQRENMFLWTSINLIMICFIISSICAKKSQEEYEDGCSEELKLRDSFLNSKSDDPAANRQPLKVKNPIIEDGGTNWTLCIVPENDNQHLIHWSLLVLKEIRLKEGDKLIISTVFSKNKGGVSPKYVLNGPVSEENGSFAYVIPPNDKVIVNIMTSRPSGERILLNYVKSSSTISDMATYKLQDKFDFVGKKRRLTFNYHYENFASSDTRQIQISYTKSKKPQHTQLEEIDIHKGELKLQSFCSAFDGTYMQEEFPKEFVFNGALHLRLTVPVNSVEMVYGYRISWNTLGENSTISCDKGTTTPFVSKEMETTTVAIPDSLLTTMTTDMRPVSNPTIRTSLFTGSTWTTIENWSTSSTKNFPVDSTISFPVNPSTRVASPSTLPSQSPPPTSPPQSSTTTTSPTQSPTPLNSSPQSPTTTTSTTPSSEHFPRDISSSAESSSTQEFPSIIMTTPRTSPSILTTVPSLPTAETKSQPISSTVPTQWPFTVSGTTTVSGISSLTITSPATEKSPQPSNVITTTDGISSKSVTKPTSESHHENNTRPILTTPEPSHDFPKAYTSAKLDTGTVIGLSTSAAFLGVVVTSYAFVKITLWHQRRQKKRRRELTRFFNPPSEASA